MDIWLNQKFMFSRKKFYNADGNFAPSNKRDVEGTHMDKTHAKAWHEKKT